jgi:hypothetical protein
MPDEYALLRWETEGGASRRDGSEPWQESGRAEQAAAEKEEPERLDRAERPGPPVRRPPAAPGPALRPTAQFS